MGPDGWEQEVRLNSYAEIKRRKGMFEEVLESICHGAPCSGVGKMLGVSASQVCEGWKARSRELLAEFRGRDLSKLDVPAMMVDGVFLSKERCMVVALPVMARWMAFASHPSGRILMCSVKNHFTPNFFHTGFTEYYLLAGRFPPATFPAIQPHQSRDRQRGLISPVDR